MRKSRYITVLFPIIFLFLLDRVSAQEWEMIEYKPNEMILLDSQSVRKNGYLVDAELQIKREIIGEDKKYHNKIAAVSVRAECIKSQIHIREMIYTENNNTIYTKATYDAENESFRDLVEVYNKEIISRICNEIR